MRNITLLFMALALITSCSTENPDNILYENDFSLEDDLINFTTFNDTEITTADPNNELIIPECLNIKTHCASMISTVIGPFDQDYHVTLKCRIKTRWSARIQMSLNGNESDNVLIKTEEYLPADMDWRSYESEELFVPAGEEIILYFVPGGTQLIVTYFDDLVLSGRSI